MALAAGFATSITPQKRLALRDALAAYLIANKDVLKDAPRFFYTDRGEDKSRFMTIRDAIRALIEEAEEMFK